MSESIKVFKRFWHEHGGMHQIILESNQLGLEHYKVTSVDIGQGDSGSVWAEFTCFKQ